MDKHRSPFAATSPSHGTPAGPGTPTDRVPRVPRVPRVHRGPTLAVTVTALAAAAVAVGCFGGGDDDDMTPPGQAMGTSVPDSALASSTAYTQFTLMTSQATSETAEPLTADNVTVPPASETDEPAPVT